MLSRKLGESIVIPGINCTVTVVEVAPGRVRLGITAPAEVAVHREEVWQKIRHGEGALAPRVRMRRTACCQREREAVG